MDFDNLSDELKERLEAAETREELAAIAEENGFELSDDVLDDVAGGGGWRTIIAHGDSCKRVVLRRYCKRYDPQSGE